MTAFHALIQDNREFKIIGLGPVHYRARANVHGRSRESAGSIGLLL